MFGEERRLLEKIINDLLKQGEILVKIIDRLTREEKEEKVHLVLTQNLNNTKSIIMSLSLNVGQFSIGSLALIDSDTQAQVAATFANISFAGNNDATFTVTPEVNGSGVSVTAVAAGTGSVSATADATYTDANTQQSVTKTLTVSVDVTVVAVVAGENVALQLNFGKPQP